MNPRDTIIVQVFILTVKYSSDDEAEEVYENINILIENMKVEGNLILMGDWNAVVGDTKVNNVT